MMHEIHYVPYSKGNEIDKRPLPHNIRLTVGPMPIEYAASAKGQVEGQGWKVEHICFAGVQKVSSISMAQQPTIPMYHLILCKELCEGDEIINPVLKF